MALRAGQSRDEYHVEARDMNQSFIGQQFGYNAPDRTVYGRLGGVEMSDQSVVIWVEGISDPASARLELQPSDRVHFARTTGDWQLRETVQELFDYLRARG